MYNLMTVTMNEKTKPLIKFCIDLSTAFLSIFLSYIFLYNFDFISINATDIATQFALFSFIFTTIGLYIFLSIKENYLF